MDSTLTTKCSTGGLVAKSPTNSDNGGRRRLVSSSSKRKSNSGRGEAALLGAGSALQLAAGLLMVVFGALCASYGVTLARLGAGLWGGLVSALAGLLGALALLHGTCRSNPGHAASLYVTAYLAVCLVSLAVNTLVLVLTLTAVVRDSNIDPDLLSTDDQAWAGRWCGIGLISATGLHLVTTLISLPLSCRTRWMGGSVRSDRGKSHRRHGLADTSTSGGSSSCRRGNGSPRLQPLPPSSSTPPYLTDHAKHTMIASWLGQHHLAVSRSPAPPPPPYHHILPYFIQSGREGRGPPPPLAPYHVPPRPPTEKSRRSSHRPSRPHSSNDTDLKRIEEQKRQEAKEKRRLKELSDQELDRTYTGLDREIAEEFISIAMQPKPPPATESSSISHVFP